VREICLFAVKNAFLKKAARRCCHRNAFGMAGDIEYAPLESSSILFILAIETTEGFLADG
jgi:hypothetical protein